MSDTNPDERKVSRRSLLMWTGALAGAAIVGAAAGFGGDILVRPNTETTKTETTTTTTSNPPPATISYKPPLSAEVKTRVNAITQDLIGRHTGETVTYTACSGSQCWRNCIVRVRSKNGVITAFEPDDSINGGIAREDQISGAVDKGLIQIRGCPMSYSWKKMLYAPTRVLYPMKRVGNRGEGKFARITWDEALDTFASMVKNTKDKYGPTSIFSTMTNFANELGQWYGAGVVGWGAWSGQGIGNSSGWVRGSGSSGQDVGNYLSAKLIILWGYTPSSYAQGEASYYLAMAREKGIPIISIEGRYSPTTEVCSDQWIPIRPTTDTALMAAITNVWFKDDSYDKAFVNQWVEPTGFQKWKDYVTGVEDGTDKTPEWAEKICAVPADTIRDLARLWIKSKPVNVNYALSVGRAFWGQNNSRAVIYLVAMSGNLGIPGTCDPTSVGTGLGISKGTTPSVNWQRGKATYGAPTMFQYDKWNWALELRSQLDAGKITLADMNAKIGNVRTNPAHNIHMLVWVSNQIQQIPDTNSSIRAFKAMDYVVAFSQETYAPRALYADLLLPQVYAWFEGLSNGSSAGTDRFRAGRGGLANYWFYLDKIVDPPGEAKAMDWFWVQAARRLGVAQLQSPLLANVSDTDWNTTMEKLHQTAYETWAATDAIKPLNPPSWADFKKKPIWRYTITAPEYSFSKAIPAGTPMSTTSGKIEFFSSLVANGPDYLATHDFPTGSGQCYGPGNLPPMARFMTGGKDVFYGEDASKYPILVSSPHSPYRQHSFLDNNPMMAGHVYRHALWLSVADANKRGITDGDSVHVFNDLGEVVMPAYVTSRIIPGYACIFEGGWYTPSSWKTAKMPDGIDKRGNINFLTSNETVPRTINDHLNCKALVEVEKL